MIEWTLPWNNEYGFNNVLPPQQNILILTTRKTHLFLVEILNET